MSCYTEYHLHTTQYVHGYPDPFVSEKGHKSDCHSALELIERLRVLGGPKKEEFRNVWITKHYSLMSRLFSNTAIGKFFNVNNFRVNYYSNLSSRKFKCLLECADNYDVHYKDSLCMYRCIDCTRS
ncbi:MAG: hypothetical protein Q8K60_02275 [Parachlamydiaceae bacterium]|nr:hypothetical protein [Parachlamydiaceae bacterium]